MGLYHSGRLETHVGDSQRGETLNHCGEQHRRFVRGSAIALRDDFDGSGLRRLAKAAKDAGQSRRCLALAEIYDGGDRSDAARMSGVGLQVIRDWVLRFNADGPDGLIDRKASGPVPKLNDAQRHALARVVKNGPIPATHGVVRWRLKDLAQWVLEEFRISLDETTVSRELKALGFVKISARPRHYAQNELAIENFKKHSRCVGGDPSRAPGQYRDRALVAGRSADRPEEQDHPALGTTRNPAQGAPGPTYPVGLYLRRHLSRARRRGGPRPAPLQHPGHAMASR